MARYIFEALGKVTLYGKNLFFSLFSFIGRLPDGGRSASLIPQCLHNFLSADAPGR